MAMERWILVGTLSFVLNLGLVAPGLAQAGEIGADPASPGIRLLNVADQLNDDVQADPGLAALYASMLGAEYGTSQSEIVWALDQDISWGQIAMMSYVQATTGRSFEKLVWAGAHTDVTEYATQVEMSHDKMTQSLERFASRAIEERNSRIFDRLRSTRRVDTLPDLGAGFGLFQEALDLRELGPPGPIKVHTGSGFAKGGTEN